MVVWRGRPRPRSIAQTVSYLLSNQPRHPDNFIPAGLAGSNSNGRTRHIQKFAKNSMQASLALPSAGGAVSATLRASPTCPVIAFFFARGWTLTAKLTPAGKFLITAIESLYQGIIEDTEGNLRTIDPVFLCVLRDLCGYAFVLSPKIAVPTRTHVDPSSIATSKS